MRKLFTPHLDTNTSETRRTLCQFLPACLGLQSRQRMTQIMNLLMLAPALQEQILFLSRVEAGREDVCLRDLQWVAGVMAWSEQQASVLEIFAT